MKFNKNLVGIGRNPKFISNFFLIFENILMIKILLKFSLLILYIIIYK